MYAPKNRAIKQAKELKGQIHKSIITVGEFNNPLLTTEKVTR